MERDLMRILVFCIAATAIAVPAVAEVGATEEAGTRLVEAVHLSGSFDGRELAVLVPVGAPIAITDPRRGTKIQLIPTIQPGTRTPATEVALQIVDVSDDGASNLLDILLLTEGEGRSTSLRVPLEIELVEAGTLEVSAGSGPEGNMRPRQCCIICGSYTICGFCVYSTCGNCCVLN